MVSLEVIMKNHIINIDSTTTSSSSSHGHALSSFVFSLNATSSSSFNECHIDSGAYYHMVEDKSIFFSLNECNTKKIFIVDNIYLIVVGSGKIQVYNGHFNDVLCVPNILYNLL
jgi:hypothetical protein